MTTQQNFRNCEKTDRLSHVVPPHPPGRTLKTIGVNHQNRAMLLYLATDEAEALAAYRRQFPSGVAMGVTVFGGGVA